MTNITWRSTCDILIIPELFNEFRTIAFVMYIAPCIIYLEAHGTQYLLVTELTTLPTIGVSYIRPVREISSRVISPPRSSDQIPCASKVVTGTSIKDQRAQKVG